jgi:hypothetical protein
MNRTTWTSCLLSVSLIAACGGSDSPNVDTVAETLDSADFCSYRTYDFYDISVIPGSDVVQPELVANADAIATEAIANEFAALGMTRDAERPDLKVNRAYYSSTEIQLEQACIPYGWGYYWGYDCGWLVANEYTLGAMVIDMVDRAGDELVLRGVSNSAVDTQGKNLESRITKGVSQVFDYYQQELVGCPAR